MKKIKVANYNQYNLINFTLKKKKLKRTKSHNEYIPKLKIAF